MRRSKSQPPGDFIYISLRKLQSLAVCYGVKTSFLAAEVDVEGTGGLSVGLPSVAQASVQGTVRTKHTDPARLERETIQTLEQIIRRLQKSRLPDLETEAGDVREGCWVYFRRPLRFGVGCDDSTQSVKAFIAVDEWPVSAGHWTAGLMMNGSLPYVRPPYGSEELRESLGGRSGSGTGQLFIWWDEFCRNWEARQAADLAVPESRRMTGAHMSRSPWAALSMYRLFAGDEWLDAPERPKLLHGSPCEGIAQVSYVAVDEETTLAMASPLYIRACSPG